MPYAFLRQFALGWSYYSSKKFLHFEIMHKTWWILVWVQFPLKDNLVILASRKEKKNPNQPMLQPRLQSAYRPFSHCIDQPGLGAFTAKSGRKHYNPPPLTVMWMNFDSPNFPSFCSLSAIISFQTCSNKCILYVLSFHKCIKIKNKMVNMYGVFRD